MHSENRDGPLSSLGAGAAIFMKRLWAFHRLDDGVGMTAASDKITLKLILSRDLD